MISADGDGDGDGDGEALRRRAPSVAGSRVDRVNHLALGARGEQAAWEYYRAQGCALVVRNWHGSRGELDLVVTEGDVLVICEVKTRSSDAFGDGWEAVTSAKRAKVRRLAGEFCGQLPRAHAGVRFDVASVLRRGSRYEVTLFRDAF